ncbi:50S ribosomal protein L19 [Candidatus Tremblaya princeps]|uniref:Large ribosomal subunit protein bL19 n=1 Tax=Tremblaya princeps TaxID=189385 RepID=A0A143WNH2_TREPR|nr:50S ribosomal protein L19 [Candidatus Tremblaya princeps]
MATPALRVLEAAAMGAAPGAPCICPRIGDAVAVGAGSGGRRGYAFDGVVIARRRRGLNTTIVVRRDHAGFRVDLTLRLHAQAIVTQDVRLRTGAQLASGSRP